MKYFAHHTCIKVSDIERSRAFYEKALGFREDMVVHHTPVVTSAFLISADDAIRIQLLQMPGAEISHMGYGHLGMRVEDIQESLAFHQKLGCVSQGLVEQPHQLNYFVMDPDGYETEIVQPKI